jgi:hypothetical protein
MAEPHLEIAACSNGWIEAARHEVAQRLMMLNWLRLELG